MKNTRCLRRLINDARICILLPAKGGYRALPRSPGISAGRVNFAEALGPVLVGDMLTGVDVGFTADGGHRACEEEYRIARMDVSHGSAMRLYDSVCAMERAGVSGVVLENSRDSGSPLDKQGTQAMWRLVETLVGVRWDPDFVIAARMSAFGSRNDSALAGGLADCARAGADLLFVDGSIPSCEVRKLVEEVPKGLCIDYSGVGHRPLEWRTSVLKRLQGMGVTAAVMPAIHPAYAREGGPGNAMRAALRSCLCVRNQRSRPVTQPVRRIRSTAKAER